MTIGKALLAHNPVATVQTRDPLHVFVIQVDVLALVVFLDPAWVLRLWDHDGVSVQAEREADLGRGAAVLLGDLLDDRVVQEARCSWIRSSQSQWAVADGLHVVCCHELQEVLLSEQRVKLDLVDCRRDLSVAKHVP